MSQPAICAASRVRKTLIGAAALGVLAGATPALATDLGEITLFGQRYGVQRFDYSTVQWPDPLDPSFTVSLIEVEGAHWLGNDRILLSSDAGDSLLTVKNWVIEAELTRDAAGRFAGLRYVRTVVANDPTIPGFGGFDLSPCGVTLNTGPDGLASGGDLLVGDSEQNGISGYSLATGALLGSFSGGTANDSFDDLAYVPTNNLIYTINEDGFRLVSFTTAGAFVASTPIPGLAALNPAFERGSPKGMVFLPDGETTPAGLRRPGGSLLITLDDNNPGLQAFDLDGVVIGTEPLTNNPAVPGASLLDLGPDCAAPLQLESVAFDPDTGTLFLIHEGAFTTCSGFFVLTPIVAAGCPCPADFDGSGGTPDGSDISTFFAAWVIGDASADVDCTGGTPDGTDIDVFFTAWIVGGC